MRCVLILLLCLAFGCSSKSNPPAPPDAEAGSQPAMTRLVSTPFGQGRLAIYYTGDPPKWVHEGVVMGECLEAEVRFGKEAVWSLGSMSECDGAVKIDFSQTAAGKLVLTYHTYDPRRGDDTEIEIPFIETTVQLRDGAIQEADRLLLEKEPYDAAKAAQLVKKLRESLDREDTEDPWPIRLGHLRNMAVDRPDEILKLLEGLESHPNVAFSEILHGFIGEIEWIRKIQSGK